MKRTLSPLLSVERADLILPCGFAVLGVIEMITQRYSPAGLSVAVYLAACVVLTVRRVFPLAVPIAIAGVQSVGATLGLEVSEPATWLLPMPLATFSSGLYVPARRMPYGILSVIASLIITLGTLEFLTSFDPDVFFGVIWMFGPMFIGIALRRAFEHNRELGAELERERVRQQVALAAERDAIARELHDLLAHSLSVMIVQASMAEDLLPNDIDAAVGALREVQQSGRAALAETSYVLKAVREGEEASAKRPSAAAKDLPALVDDYARAGLDVIFHTDPVLEDLPPGVGLSTYRIIQEALTNALKYASGSKVDVSVQREKECLAIEVRNGPGVQRPEVGVSGGHGLEGLSARVSLFGGTFDAGRTDDRGFVVRARLPLANHIS